MLHFTGQARWWLPTLGTVAAILWLTYTTRPASADTVLTTCDNSTLQTAINAGGVITFNCGVSTIAISSVLTVNTAATIDGGDQITLDGGGTSRIFLVGAGGNLTLKKL